jgi:hypothetical protein
MHACMHVHTHAHTHKTHTRTKHTHTSNRMRGFRVDLDRPILQEIDAKKLTARNVEPITFARWLFGGVRYTNR